MSLYPTLEDLKVDMLTQAQLQSAGVPPTASTYQAGAPQPAHISYPANLYPVLNDYMGFDLGAITANNQIAVGSGWAVQTVNNDSRVVAPITHNDVGISRAEIKPGMRQLVACKDGKGKLGVVVQGVNKGVFVCFVYKNSPASQVGLRFGDQILDINNQTVAGWSTDKAMNFLKKCPKDKITMIVRDRPFERIISMNKDSRGYVGFVFKNGKITDIAKDSSAARNGLLIDHQLVEVNGTNVVGLRDKEIQQIIDRVDQVVTVTVMPCPIYDHIIKHLDSGLMKKHMDHSVPEV